MQRANDELNIDFDRFWSRPATAQFRSRTKPAQFPRDLPRCSRLPNVRQATVSSTSQQHTYNPKTTIRAWSAAFGSWPPLFNRHQPVWSRRYAVVTGRRNSLHFTALYAVCSTHSSAFRFIRARGPTLASCTSLTASRDVTNPLSFIARGLFSGCLHANTSCIRPRGGGLFRVSFLPIEVGELRITTVVTRRRSKNYNGIFYIAPCGNLQNI